MTQLVINSTQELQRYLESAQQWAQECNHRACIVIELATAAPAHLQLAQLCSGLPEQTLWIGDGQAASDRIDQISAQLGTETALVAYNATSRLAPDLFAATAASVFAGGLFLLLCPDLDTWGLPPHSKASAAIPGSGAQSHFQQRFVRMLRQHGEKAPAGIRMVQLASTFSSSSPSIDFDKRRERLAQRAVAPGGILHAAKPDQKAMLVPAPDAKIRRRGGQSGKLPAWHEKQNQCLEQLTAFCTREKACAVTINAARGRGKSALLGRLAARLDSQGESWQVTSNRRSATESLQRHWLLDGNGRDSSFPWLPVDQALRSQGKYLLVDEAADIPIASLQVML